MPFVPLLPLVVILGPTAAGKSALAVALALRLGGEVVSADAMAVYRGMDLGTAKPTEVERQGVPHHCLSALEPEDHCDATRWLELAETALTGIRDRGHRAIVAGGTPLYVKALLEGLSTGAPRDAAVRAELAERYEREGAAVLFAELQRVDPTYAAAHHPNDRLRVVRALEVWRLTGRAFSSFHTTDGVRRTDVSPLLLGLRWPREELYRRIDRRTLALFAHGLIDEVKSLRHRLSPEARQAVGYKEVIAHLDGAIDLAESERQVARNSRHLAKHQLTWYRRWDDLRWLPGDADDLIEQAEALARPWFDVK
jgi:tRNA dimethylallyltransferase